MARRAFTLIELLVVIAIMALLIGVLLPALAGARRTAKSAACLATQKSVAYAFASYYHDHRDLVVPSYNMTGIDTTEPLDGWGPIFDRDGYMDGARQTTRGPFVCPETLDIDALATGQTGTDPKTPKGWMDWPTRRVGESFLPTEIPERGFNRIVRVSYWMNALNPIGGLNYFEQDLYYTVSVGYGPTADGEYARQMKISAFVRPSQLIGTADGVYAGRHRDNKIGTPNSRIGYRHPGVGGGSANVGFSDAHAASLDALRFPRGLGGDNDPTRVREENLYGRPSIYADPERALARW
ncbi:hypothetical protein PHYC_02557 [Phycisphaerales bacterium]|nr:hypothetical protein PHYC_02557 [Phycisphaerales bacterium]